MPIIKVTKEFKYSEDGLHVELIIVGEHDVSDKCADIAVNQLEVAEYAEGEPPKEKVVKKNPTAKK